MSLPWHVLNKAVVACRKSCRRRNVDRPAFFKRFAERWRALRPVILDDITCCLHLTSLFSNSSQDTLRSSVLRTSNVFSWKWKHYRSAWSSSQLNVFGHKSHSCIPVWTTLDLVGVSGSNMFKVLNMVQSPSHWISWILEAAQGSKGEQIFSDAVAPLPFDPCWCCVLAPIEKLCLQQSKHISFLWLLIPGSWRVWPLTAALGLPVSLNIIDDSISTHGGRLLNTCTKKLRVEAKLLVTLIFFWSQSKPIWAVIPLVRWLKQDHKMRNVTLKPRVGNHWTNAIMGCLS